MRLAGRPSLAFGVAAAWAVVGLLWLADAAGRGLPARLDRTALAAALLGAAVLTGRAVLRTARAGPAARILLLLVALSLVLCFAGLDHEVTGRDFGDEGIYRAHAQRINEQGQILRPWFVYPHLLFYLDAVALWIAGLFQPAVDALARLLYGVEGELAVATLVTRTVTALLGALLPVPVFVTARRVAGDAAAVPAAALAALSPIAVGVAHLNLSDVAAAFFAALTVASASALLDREERRDYLRAGLWAGLAAGSKYPGGVAAVAVAALWLRRRLAERRMRWGLLWAAGAALAAFLATTPSLLAFPEAAFGGGSTDVLFGVRQYAAGGWTGVVRASNSLFYGGELAAGYGWPALVVGLAGLAGLPRRDLGRLAWLLPFPLIHAALLLGLEMAVERNLLPVLPMVSVILGCGLAGAWRLLGRLALPRPARRAAAAVLAAGVLTWPALAAAAEVVRLSRPTTREEAAAWIEGHLPPGSFLVQEAYTPHL
ncbi:MAG TPA: glycosyltransferase family 39 protein, partial [Thermoanaerobaculia bacterium]